jgi:hypothetical protein
VAATFPKIERTDFQAALILEEQRPCLPDPEDLNAYVMPSSTFFSSAGYSDELLEQLYEKYKQNNYDN